MNRTGAQYNDFPSRKISQQNSNSKIRQKITHNHQINLSGFLRLRITIHFEPMAKQKMRELVLLPTLRILIEKFACSRAKFSPIFSLSLSPSLLNSKDYHFYALTAQRREIFSVRLETTTERTRRSNSIIRVKINIFTKI